VEMFKRSWVTIDLARLRENYRVCRALISPRQEIMAVVKADGYGHGAVTVARTLQSAGCRHFAVATLDEALELRAAGIAGQILILGYTPAAAAEELLAGDITQALISEEHAQSFVRGGFKAHFAVDTGMNRIGLDADRPEECAAAIRRFGAKFRLTGLFTHLCVADTPEEDAFTARQIDKFKRVASLVGDLKLPYIHCMNSAGGLWHEPFGDLVRLGIVLYGLKPDRGNTLPAGIKPVLKWHSVVSMIKEVRAGETIGYGRTFRAAKTLRVATIPTRYADGYDRMLSNRGCVTIRGRQAPVVGRVCMDQIMADVTGIPAAAFGDEVLLLDDGHDADAMAERIGTIGYEVVCGISPRVPRVCVNGEGGA
ncbi:MAG: alanine racemase, partial [Lentisphaeria bacterium]|nr:alanine racemase [Lentisphaeria bacterium]